MESLRKSGTFPNLRNLEGWDINPSAIEIARKKHPQIKVNCDDLFKHRRKYNIVIWVDVIKQVENPYEFMR